MSGDEEIIEGALQLNFVGFVGVEGAEILRGTWGRVRGLRVGSAASANTDFAPRLYIAIHSWP